MITIIHKISEKSKSLRASYSYIDWYHKNRLILLRLLVIFLVSMTSFLLGIAVAIKPLDSEIGIIYPELSVPRAVYIPENQRKNYLSNTGDMLSGGNTSQTPQTTLGNFVASKNGAKFYPVTCKSASRIKPENQIFFATETEATSRGYELSDQCTSSN